MSATRRKPIVSLLALVAVLFLTGARTLHSDPIRFDHALTNDAAATCTPCILCNTPACAVVVSAVQIVPQAAADGRVVAELRLVHSSLDDVSVHVRPPPQLFWSQD